MVDTSLIIGLVPFTPVLAAFALPVVYLASRNRAVVFVYTSAVLLVVFALSTLVAIDALASDYPLVFKAGGWPAPIGIVYVVDKFTSVVAAVSALILFLVAVYSISYITDGGYPWYAALLLGLSSGILGVTYTGDAFNLFVMLEVTGVAAYSLVMYYMRRADSLVSGLKYAFIGALGTTLYLLAMGLTYGVFGTLNFADMSLKLRAANSEYAYIGYGLIMVTAFWAFSIKSGVFPNHFWLPDAHPAAPTPISALLSGLVVNTGIIGLYRFLYVVSWSTPQSPLPAPLEAVKSFISLLAIGTGAVSAFFGGLLMFVQNDIKRLIAYSTIMNLGFLFMAAGCATQHGLSALLFYVVVHSIAKAVLFLSAGVFIKAAGTRNLDRLSGLGPRYPVAGFALAVSALTLAGLPPLPGFFAKILLYEALFEYNIALAILMVVASAVGLISYMRLVYTILLGVPVTKPLPLQMRLAKASLLVSSLVLIALGMAFLAAPMSVVSQLHEVASQVTTNAYSYIKYLEETLLKLT